MIKAGLCRNTMKVTDLMNLFSDYQRHIADERSDEESWWEYLDRSSEIDIAHIREWMERWFQSFPESGQNDLAGRLRANDAEQAIAAFFELYLHRFLTCAGCSVTIHPELPGSKGTHPDFLVQEPSGLCFILEARVASGMNDAERGAVARQNYLMDRVRHMHSDYLYALDTDGDLPDGFKVGSYVKWLKKVETTLNLELHEQELPQFEFIGYKIRTTAYAKLPSERGKTGSLFCFTDGAHWGNPVGYLRKAIEHKASRYGKMTVPYVIALQDVREPQGRGIQQALFGTEEIEGVIGQPNSGRVVRKRDGAFSKSSEVSAVLLISNLTIWDHSLAHGILFHNPQSHRPYGGIFNGLPNRVLRPSEGGFIHSPGKALGSWLTE